MIGRLVIMENVLTLAYIKSAETAIMVNVLINNQKESACLMTIQNARMDGSVQFQNVGIDVGINLALQIRTATKTMDFAIDR